MFAPMSTSREVLPLARRIPRVRRTNSHSQQPRAVICPVTCLSCLLSCTHISQRTCCCETAASTQLRQLKSASRPSSMGDADLTRICRPKLLSTRREGTPRVTSRLVAPRQSETRGTI
eukprot:scaffold37466_cov59-Phaeocystis_antarctica.AAC.3